MSYYCTISFKNIDPKDVYTFFQDMKKIASERIDQIALDSPSFSPIMKAYHFQDPFEITDQMREETKRWATESIFKYRYFYDSERALLGVYSLPDCLRDLFDLTFHFQDSCEQDYDFEDWNGVPSFEFIAEKWKNTSDEKMIDLMNERLDSDFDRKPDQIDYYRKTFCYDEIWKTISWTLDDDAKTVYLSIFGYWDFLPLQQFVNATEKAVLSQIEEWKNEIYQKKISDPYVKDAAFTSVWDGGVEITTNCKVNTKTKEIFDVQKYNGDDLEPLESLEEEYITIDGERYEALNTADFPNIRETDFWYKK